MEKLLKLKNLSMHIRFKKDSTKGIPVHFYEYYQKKISEGKTKKQALKCVQRRLVNIIWGMMTHKVEYINPPTEILKPLENVV